jgi:predicted transcriptional regulator YdeE
MESSSAGIQIVQPELVNVVETWVMGFETRTTHQQESNPLTAGIPKLWQQFWAEQRWRSLPEVLYPPKFYGIYTDYAGNQTDAYSYSWIGAVEVSSIDNPPENMVGLTVPAGNYLVFRTLRSSPTAGIQIWQQVWNYFVAPSAYQRAFTTDFERFDPQQVELYIAVKPVL